MADERREDLETLASLGEPVRRALYRFVVEQAEPVSREQAAAGVSVARHTAKFHLDKLVDDGLLEVEYARPPGRGGPGAGRPAKRYRRAAREVAVSFPPRHYDFAGRLLAQAVTDATAANTPVSDALARAARDAGRTMAEQARRVVGKRRSRAAILDAATNTLRDCGYEPHVDESGVYLTNCPFHALAREYTDIVCGMNLELIDGLVEGLGGTGLEAVLAPQPGRCCVRLQVGERAAHGRR